MICPACGTEFDRRRHNQRFCSDACQRRAHRREYDQRRPKSCVDCGAAIVRNAERCKTCADALRRTGRYTDSERQMRRAHDEVKRALQQGRLDRPTQCGRCGDACRPDAHHEDYGRPLDVEWLCRSCHRDHHAEQVAA